MSNLVKAEDVKEPNALQKAQERMRQGAERYIAADRTDPFTRDRVYSHMANGVASVKRAEKPYLDGYYDAERYHESRFYMNGTNKVEYTVPAYRSMVRP